MKDKINWHEFWKLELEAEKKRKRLYWRLSIGIVIAVVLGAAIARITPGGPLDYIFYPTAIFLMLAFLFGE